MKKLLLPAILAIFVFTSGADAQNEAESWYIGGGFGYHTDWDDNNTGIVLEGVYSFQDHIRFSAGILYYLVDDESWGGTTYSFTVYDLNLNAHYLFKNEEDMRIYALGGINSLRVKTSGGGESSSKSKEGLNLGAGIEYNVGTVMLFGELKMVTGDGHDNKFILHAGVRYRIK